MLFAEEESPEGFKMGDAAILEKALVLGAERTEKILRLATSRSGDISLRELLAWAYLQGLRDCAQVAEEGRLEINRPWKRE